MSFGVASNLIVINHNPTNGFTFYKTLVQCCWMLSEVTCDAKAATFSVRVMRVDKYCLFQNLDDKHVDCKMILFTSSILGIAVKLISFWDPNPSLVANFYWQKIRQLGTVLFDHKINPQKFKQLSINFCLFQILRNHVMVRVGGGWDTLQNFLDKHDPCRCRRGEQ